MNTQGQAELFNQLVTLFLREGFRDVTIDALAARLRCSKSTLYALAGTRDELVRAVVVHFFREATEQVEAGLSGAPGPCERLVAYLQGVAAQLRPASAAFFDDVAAAPLAREVIRAEHARRDVTGGTTGGRRHGERGVPAGTRGVRRQRTQRDDGAHPAARGGRHDRPGRRGGLHRAGDPNGPEPWLPQP